MKQILKNATNQTNKKMTDTQPYAHPAHSAPLWINHIEIKANDKNYCLQIVWILE